MSTESSATNPIRQEESLLSGPVRLVGGAGFPHATRRLRLSCPGIDWRYGDAGDDIQIPVLHLSEDRGLAEGAFRIRVEVDDGGAPLVDVAGGPFSGVVYGVDELIKRGRTRAGGLRIDVGGREVSPGLVYRTFWTWDHSTNWELSQIGHQETGVFNPYGKPSSGFLSDYKRLVDFCSLNRIAAVVIYGFLRDGHGGIETAQELCGYANERGVRILPGIAIGAYGGVYWEGNHRYNLATWLRMNPQFASSDRERVVLDIPDLAYPQSYPYSDYTMLACPSAPETMEWMTEAVAWLAATFEIGGVNIESGDYGVCACDRCADRRRGRDAGDAGESWSHVDMADNFPRLFEAANAERKNLWIYSELQWDNLLDARAHESTSSMPPGGIYQHTANRTYWRRLKRDLSSERVSKLSTQPNVLRAQFGSQWNGDRRTDRLALNAKAFAEMAQTSHAVGMHGLTVWGEPSPLSPPGEY